MLFKSHFHPQSLASILGQIYRDGWKYGSQMKAKIYAFPRWANGQINIDGSTQQWFLNPLRHTIIQM